MAKAQPSARKLRGGYPTPESVARFLSDWAVRSASERVLEPSCGDGSFLDAAAHSLVSRGLRLRRLGDHLTGVELDRPEADQSIARLGVLGVPHPERVVHTRDFFQFCAEVLDSGRRYDSIIGNPPFIRYHDFPEQQREVAFQIMTEAGLHPNRLTNAWAPFVVGSTRLLGNPGRLGMVIPAELLQVGYAAEVRKFLSESFSRITIITFRKLLFGPVQQEVVLLLGEKNGSDRLGIRTVELNDAADLSDFRESQVNATTLKPMDHSTEKWTQYFLRTEQIDLFRSLTHNPGIARLGTLASIDVGIVTGINHFFVLSESQVGENGLEAFVRPLVARSAHLEGLVFSKSDWEKNVAEGLPTFLLDVPSDTDPQKIPQLREYIQDGESKGFQSGYKCRIRDPWWQVPSAWVPAGFFLRQIHDYPKMVVNAAAVTSTDTIHRVRILDDVDPSALSATLLNSLTLAHAEIVGRSYGGGVLELEPREAERLMVPSPLSSPSRLRSLDGLIRAGKIDEALDLSDRVLLRDQLALSAKQVELLRSAWEMLRDRRNGRRTANREKYSPAVVEPTPGRVPGIAST